MNWLERLQAHEELVRIRRRVMHLAEAEECLSSHESSVSEAFDERGQDAGVSSSRKRSRDFGELP